MPTQHIIQFMSAGYRLTGTLHLPENDLPAVVVGCHGLLANRHSPKQITLAETLNRAGVAYFRFDHRGCGDSEGAWPGEALLTSRCKDLYHAIHAMETHPAVGPLAGLFGSSFGGTVVMATAVEQKIPCIVTYAAPIDSRTVRPAAADQIQSHHGLAVGDLTALAFDIGPKLSMLNDILIMHGESDEIVPSAHAHQIYQSAQTPKKLILYSGGDHRLSQVIHQQQFLDECLAWYRRYL